MKTGTDRVCTGRADGAAVMTLCGCDVTRLAREQGLRGADGAAVTSLWV